MEYNPSPLNPFWENKTPSQAKLLGEVASQINARTDPIAQFRSILSAPPSSAAFSTSSVSSDLNLLVNGDFELGSNAGGLFQNDFTVPGWNAFPDLQGDRVLQIVPSLNTTFGNSLKLDTIAGRHDRIYQDVQVIAGESYLLSMELLGQGGTSTRSEEVRVYWDGAPVGVFEGMNKWQSVSAVVTATKTGTSRLEIRETNENGLGGDGLGPLLDKITLVPVKSKVFSNGSFELGDLSPDKRIYNTSEIPNWESDGPPEDRNIRIRPHGNPGDNGRYYWTLDSFANRYDRLFHAVETSSSKNYYLTFDMRSPIGDTSKGNQLRIRWNDKWVDTHYASTVSQTHVVALPGELDGTSWLDLREALTSPTNYGDAEGPWLDNFRLYEVDTSLADNSAIILAEDGQIGNEQKLNVQLFDGQSKATSISFDVFPRFDRDDYRTAASDRLNISLVSPNDATVVLLDNGVAGSSIFSLTEKSAEFPSGRVKFDGRTVTIDLTEIPSHVTNFDLLFQAVDTDGDGQSKYFISPVVRDFDGNSSPAFLRNVSVSAPGGTLDFGLLTDATNIEVNVENVRLVSGNGQYAADVRIKSLAGNTGRNVALVFDNLPSGVTLTNPSGFTAGGSPYLNMRPAIKPGGLRQSESSGFVAIYFESTALSKFEFSPVVKAGMANRAPVFPAIGDIVIMPGDVLRLNLNVTDPDGDTIKYLLVPTEQMPKTYLNSDGILEIAPSPDQVGSYQFAIDATDGVKRVRQSVRVEVQADPVTTTRITGYVLDTDQSPLPGIPVELGTATAVTDSTGKFVVEFTGTPPSDALVIRGEAWTGPQSYPYIAEKLPLLFGRELYPNVNNVIIRPIYLPALDLSQGDFINPASASIVDSTLRAGEAPVQVFVAAGTLRDQQGNPFSGLVSITEVPANFTPAALPVNMLPDVVVTIQPGEMVFTTPAPLTFPNRSGWAPGTLMDLWSINPVTGDFDKVGQMRVSTDGTKIETISGGIRNSSWHFPAPSGTPGGGDDPFNEGGSCDECKAQFNGKSFVEAHSGTLREWHDLVTYQSLGETRGLSLHYDSVRANPQPIVHFGYDDVIANAGARLVARLTLERGNFQFQVPGVAPGVAGLRGGENIWSLPDSGDIRAAFQVDMSSLPTGVYGYNLDSGLLAFRGGRLSGSTVSQPGQLIHINSIGNIFGNGWGLKELTQVIENPSGDVLLVDGDGGELKFGPSQQSGSPLESPPGDFTSLTKQPDGTYRRVHKDGQIDTYNVAGFISSVRDRNGNETQYLYSDPGKLTTIIDPVGLQTQFVYTGNFVGSITDPAGRVTQLQHDNSGNLTKITDPDGSVRTFEYDARRLMTAEINKRGFREEIVYNDAGRVTREVLPDGGVMRYDVVQGTVLRPSEQTLNPFLAPPVFPKLDAVARYSDPNGNVLQYELDQQGQVKKSINGGESAGSISRNDDNLVNISIDGRDNRSDFVYDEQGNLIRSRIAIGEGEVTGSLFPGREYPVGRIPNSLTEGDVNNDGIMDILTANQFPSQGAYFLSLLLGNVDGTFAEQELIVNGFTAPRSITAGDVNGDGNIDIITSNYNPYSSVGNIVVLLGNGDGTFGNPRLFGVGTRPASVVLGDIDGDGILDVATANRYSNNVSVLLGNGDGTFATQQLFSVGNRPRSVALGDVNGDSVLDLVTGNDDSDDVSVLLGVGDGTFAIQQRFWVGQNPRSVTVGDVNGDSKLDILTANFSSSSVSLLIGNGDGTFANQLQFTVGFNPKSVTLDDIDRDGFLDVATANSDGISVLLGTGNGTFGTVQQFATSNPVTLFFQDVNDDGRLDAITVNGSSDYVGVLLGNGDGTFVTRQRYDVGSDPRSVALGDVNGDGRLDAVISNAEFPPIEGNVSVLLGNGDGSFGTQRLFSVGGNPVSVSVADLNADGHLDVVTANELQNTVSVLLGIGDGTFASSQQYTVGVGPRFVALGDINGDGHPDVVTANRFSTVSVLLGNGDGTFAMQQLFSVGSIPHSLTLGDVNGDGRLDAVAANTSQNISVLIGNGDGTFAAPQQFSVGTSLASAALGDINGDGILDVVTANVSNSVSVFLGNGDGTFAAQQDFSVGNSPSSVALGDINGDGRLDVATTNSLSFNVSVLLGNGDGTYAPQQLYSVGSSSYPRYLIMGDLDGDGGLDITTVNRYDDITVLLNVRSSRTSLVRRYEYEPTYNRITKAIDENNHTTLYEIDPANGNTLSVQRVVGAVDAPGGENDDVITRYSYTANGLVDIETDPLNRVSDYDYDGFGRLIKVTSAVGTPDESVMRYEYDDAGNQTAVIDGNLNRTTYEFDPLNRMIRTIEADPDGAGPLASPVTDFRYDANGNNIGVTDAQGRISSTQFDPLDRMILAIAPDPDGTGPLLAPITRFTYDLSGNQSQVIDPNGNVTQYRYDARNRMKESIDPDGGVTVFIYDSNNNRTRIIDPVGNVTRFGYDERNRLVKEIDPLGKEIQYRYSGTDQLIEKTDRNGRKTIFEHDDLDRVIAEIWLDENGSTVNSVTYEYDKASNLRYVADDQSGLMLDYDELNRLKMLDNLGSLPGGTPNAPHVVLNYTYDDVGNVLSVSDSVNGIPGGVNAYNYDALNRNVSVKQTGTAVSEKLVNFAFNSLGQYQTISRFSDLARTNLVARTWFSYDQLNRLQTLEHGSDSNHRDIAFSEFEYDSAGRILALIDVDGRTDFDYDNRDQLTGADREPTDIRGAENYTYDANGNRIESQLHGDGYVTGPGNRLLSDGTYNYAYDDEGNMIRRTDIASGDYREFSYDHRNRMTRVADHQADDTLIQEVEFSYDLLGRRISKTVDADGAGSAVEQTMHFVYDRANVLLDFLDADGTGSAQQPVQTIRYLFGAGVDQVLAQEVVATGENQWLLSDHLGTIRDIVSDSASLLKHIQIDSYGNVVSDSDTLVVNRYQFTGREFDSEIGLYYYRARFYDANIGRFVSEDVIPMPAGDPNRFRYSNNSPTMFTDPMGEDSYLFNVGSLHWVWGVGQTHQTARYFDYFPTNGLKGNLLEYSYDEFRGIYPDAYEWTNFRDETSPSIDKERIRKLRDFKENPPPYTGINTNCITTPPMIWNDYFTGPRLLDLWDLIGKEST